MSEKEMRGLLGEVCRELERRARMTLKKVALPAALGASLALGGCSDDSTTPPDAGADVQRSDSNTRDSATAKDRGAPNDSTTHHDGAGMADVGARADTGDIDMGSAPEYAAPVDGGPGPLYAVVSPDAGRIDSGPTTDYAAPLDLAVGPLYIAPDV